MHITEAARIAGKVDIVKQPMQMKAKRPDGDVLYQKQRFATGYHPRYRFDDMQQRHTAIPASYVLLRRGDEILLTLRQNTGYFDGWYVIPSGHVEEGELPIDGALREAEEEVGLTLDRAQLRLVHTMYRTKHDETGDRADYFFVVDVWEGDPVNKEPQKCKEITWFSLHALPEKIMPHVRDALEAIQKGESYSELGLDRIVRSPN